MDFVFIFSLLLLNAVNCEYNCEYKKDGFYMDDEFCHIYWRCNYGVSEEYECPAGTAWNHLESRCDWLDNVDCTRSSEATTKSETKKSKVTKSNDYDENAEETTKKIKKKTTTPETTQAIIETEMARIFDNGFDHEERKVTKPRHSDAGDDKRKLSTICDVYGSYHVADTNNCAGYYFCDEGKETKLKCGEKQLFNTETLQCEDFQQVFCGNRPVNLAERNHCQNKRDGIYADTERNCKVFYQCIGQNKVREASCPNNLKFNSVIGRCDNPMRIAAPCGTFSMSFANQIRLFPFWLELYIVLLCIKIFCNFV